MEKENLVEKLTEIFRKVLNSPSLMLHDDLTANDVDNWDSLSHMLLISEIESSLNIKFKLKELNKMKNVGDLIEITSSKMD
jgi:acyl carrier protein